MILPRNGQRNINNRIKRANNWEKPKYFGHIKRMSEQRVKRKVYESIPTRTEVEKDQEKLA